MSYWQLSMISIHMSIDIHFYPKQKKKHSLQFLLILFSRNALNIVKDDLIARVDELTGEIEILREELNAMQQSRNKLRTKVQELEEELKKTKEQVKQQSKSYI